MKTICILTGFALPLLTVWGCGEGIDPSFAGSGVIEATEVTISAKTAGTIIEFAVDEGSRVEQGGPIARIDSETAVLQRVVAAADLADIDWNDRILSREIDSVREQVSQAKIRRDLVQKTRDRLENLLADGAATVDRLDAARTEFEIGESAVRAAETRLAEATVRRGALTARRDKLEANLKLLDKVIADGTIIAPLSGEVIETYAEAGEMAAPGSPLCTIADLSTVKLRIYANEMLLGKLKLNGPVKVGVDSHPEERFDGAITWISPVAEFTPKNVQTRESRADLVYAAEITLPNPNGIFKIGMPADAYIEGIAE